MAADVRLTPPEGWRDRPDADELRLAIARLGVAEANVFRAQRGLVEAAPQDDDDERVLLAVADGLFEHLALLGALGQIRDKCVLAYSDILIRWHDQDRGAEG